MNKERVEWIASGLSRYTLTKAEDRFLKTVLEDSAQERAVTGLQEERLETLYRQKCMLMPNKVAPSVPQPSRKGSPSKGRRRPY